GLALGAIAGTLAAALAGGHVVRRRPASRLRLAGPGACLVHRPGGDLLGAPGALAAVLRALLDVRVLTLPLAPRTAGHVRSLSLALGERSVAYSGRVPRTAAGSALGPGHCSSRATLPFSPSAQQPRSGVQSTVSYEPVSTVRQVRPPSVVRS